MKKDIKIRKDLPFFPLGFGWYKGSKPYKIEIKKQTTF